MKKIIISLSILAFIFTVHSCGNNAVNEIEKSVDKMEEIIKATNEAAEDKLITDAEAEKITKLYDEFKQLNQQLENLEEKDKAALTEYEEKNKEQLEKISQDFMGSLVALMGCEGAEKINIE